MFLWRSHHHHHHHLIFNYHAGTGATSTSVGPLPGSWLATRMAEVDKVMPELSSSTSHEQMLCIFYH